jgi:hypothetical protein
VKTFKTIEVLKDGFLLRATQPEDTENYYPFAFSVEKGNKILYVGHRYKRTAMSENDMEGVFNEFTERNEEVYNQLRDADKL